MGLPRYSEDDRARECRIVNLTITQDKAADLEVKINELNQILENIERSVCAYTNSQIKDLVGSLEGADEDLSFSGHPELRESLTQVLENVHKVFFRFPSA